jgi:hypothetical protein
MASNAAGHVQHPASGRDSGVAKNARDGLSLGGSALKRLFKEREEKLRPLHEQLVSPMFLAQYCSLQS